MGCHAVHALPLCAVSGPTDGFRAEREGAADLQGLVGALDPRRKDASIMYRHKSPHRWSHATVQRCHLVRATTPVFSWHEAVWRTMTL